MLRNLSPLYSVHFNRRNLFTFLFICSVLISIADFFISRSVLASNEQPQNYKPSSNETFLFEFKGEQKNSSTLSIAGVREQEIEINFDTTNFKTAGQLKIPLFDGKVYIAEQNSQEGFVQRSSDDFTWWGKIIEGNWKGDVILTVKGKTLLGFIQSPTTVYEIFSRRDSTHVLVELDQSRFPECSIAKGKPDVQKNDIKKNSEDNNLTPGRTVQTEVDNGSLIDVLVVNTFMADLNGLTLQTLVQAFAEANAALANSGITTRLRMFGGGQVNYTETGSLQNALNWVSSNSTIATWRDQGKYDLVMLITNDLDCGIGWLMRSNSTSESVNGFSVVTLRCLLGNYTPAHEIAHNLGAAHNPEEVNTAPFLPYAYGHWNSSGNFRTVMSYNNPCTNCARVGYFSNPSVSYNGFPTGITNQRNNALALNTTAFTVSNYRVRRTTGNIGFNVPEGLTVTEGSNITLSILSDVLAPVSINYTSTPGTATQGQDYVVVIPSSCSFTSCVPQYSGTLSFPDPYFPKYVEIRTINDSIYEGNETVHVTLSNPTNGGVIDQSATRVITIIDNDPPPAKFDFDGDHKTDISVFRPSNGQWWYQQSSNNVVKALTFGVSTDKIVPADYDGDGKTDAAFFRPSTGEWFVLRSSNNTFFAAPFGTSNDIPAPGDFDGDGKADIAVFRQSQGTWYILKSSDNGVLTVPFGTNNDIPVVADYDGDGKADTAIYRPNGGSGSGEWWILKSSGGVFATPFGSATDKPVPGDYTGDGKADCAFFRPSNATWFVLRSENLTFYAAPFGTTGDIPVAGDYDGDNKYDFAVFRPSSVTWYVLKSTGGVTAQAFGATGDKPVPSAFVP